jgi:hypothetical protein
MPACAKQTRTLWVNFYAKGNGSIHFDRAAADEIAASLHDDNPRIACRPVAAMVGDGLSRRERTAHE